MGDRLSLISDASAATVAVPEDMVAVSGEDADGLPAPRRAWAMAAIWLALAMSVLDSSIANIALPTISRDLHATAAASIWVVNAYQIAITMLLLPLASLGEIVGYRRIYACGLALFVLASLACAVAPGLPELAVARFIQGWGAAAVMSMNGALVRLANPKARLGRAFGYNVVVVGLSAASGPSIAAAILTLASWRWLFAINLPVGLASIVIGWRSLPDSARSARAFDWTSAGLSATAFGCIFFVAADVAQGHASGWTVLETVLGAAAAIALVRTARRREQPLFPLDLLRVPILRLSYATSSCAFAAQTIGLVGLPFFLEAQLHAGHLVTGLIMTAWPIGLIVGAALVGRLMDRFPAGLLGGIGLGILCSGFCLLSIFGRQVPVALAGVATLLCGFGFGMFQAPNNRTMLSAAPVTRSGSATGMLATARLAGQTMGAVLVSLLFRLRGPETVVPFAVAAGLGALAATFSVGRLRAKP